MQEEEIPYKDHVKLHFLTEINRSVEAKHVTEMKESVEAHGIIRRVVVADISFITGRKVTYILDGQHLFTALVQLKMDIPIVHYERKVTNYDELVAVLSKLNTSSKSWILANYVDIWAATGKRSYTKLKNYKAKYNLPFSTLCMALNSDSAYNATDRMKRGEFVINNEKFAIQMMDNITDIFKHMKGARTEQKVLVQSYIRFYKERKDNYDHGKFIQALMNHKVRLSASLSNIPDCMKTLKDIYSQYNSRAITVVSGGKITAK